MNNLTSLKKVSLILLIIVLLPALFYSGYEISSLSTSEKMFGEMYRQQLDAVLFSLNQYSLDAVSAWAGGLQNIIADRSLAPREQFIRSVQRFVGQRSTIQAVFVCDTALTSIVNIESPAHRLNSPFLTEKKILLQLRKNREKVDRLVDFQRVEYRKLEPIALADSSMHETPLVLIFIVRDYSSTMRVVGMVLDPRDFLRNILAMKLSEAAGGELVLAVVNKRTHQILESSSDVQIGDLKQEKALWLFPDLSLGIRLRGRTIDELVETRAYRNFAIIAALDMLLLAGAWLVYRTMRREMELIQLKSDFISNVSHELRTPLSLIRMFAETLEMKRVKTEKQKYEYYRTIIQESERLSRLVNNLLNFSRMEAGKRSFSLQPANLNDLVLKVLEFYTLQLRSKNFEVVVDLNKKIPPVDVDAEAIAEALHNIVDNAIKYSDKQKFIRIATGSENSYAFVEVQDRGIGIAPEHHVRIFEKFYRVSTGLVHTTKGSGLGLALVHHIMSAHGGRVEVKSNLGLGSTFRLYIPLSSR